ncbi:MAG: type II toxin-antitoxin system mRNA interferase toxin, RelE/StbE family [Patescibacteria group bacterium]
MKISNIFTHPKFDKNYKKLPAKIKDKAKKREPLFREDAFHPILKTHRLHGQDKNSWAFWIDYNYRIKFIFLNESDVLFLDIGTHKIYK